MADELEEIKSKIDIVNFIAEYLPLKKAGRNFKALCPFHSEKTPSFVISPERQIWHCFGACSDGGDIFKFLMRMENLEFPEALEILAKRAGVKLLTGYGASESSKVRDKVLKINHLASEFYHYLLLSHPSGKQAFTYVLSRGVSKKSLETFSIGWAPNLWDSLIKFLNKKGYTNLDLETAGLVIKGQRYYDRFRGRLIFTLRNHRGEVIGFAGRTLDPAAKDAKYINTPETPVYVKGNTLYGLDVTKDAIKKEDQAVVVEGEFDLISSFQAGVANVVAIKGSALTEGHVNLLKRFTQNLTLALDTDLAGDEAARRGIEIADNAGFSIKVVKLPQGKDPDECARTSSSLWKKAVGGAIPIFDYFLDSALTRFSAETADGKRKISDEVLPVLIKIANPIVQSHYLTKLANLLSVSEEVIVQATKKLTKKEEVGVAMAAPISAPVPREELLEEHLLSLLLQSETLKQLIKTPEVQTIDDFLRNTAIKKIIKSLQEHLTPLKDFQISDFIKVLPTELVPIVDRAYLDDLGKIGEDQKLFEREFEKTVLEIKKSFLRRKLFTLAEEMRRPEKQREMTLLTKEYRQAAAELKKCQAA